MNNVDNLDGKCEKISFRVTKGEKNQLKRMAKLAGKSLGAYTRDASLSNTLDTAKIDFYKKIVDDLQKVKEKTAKQEADSLYQKKTLYAMTNLLLLIGSTQLKSKEKTVEFFKKYMEEAENKFNKE